MLVGRWWMLMVGGWLDDRERKVELSVSGWLEDV